MTELQGVLGRIQLKYMPLWHASRIANQLAIHTAARHLPGLRVPTIPPEVTHAAYKAYVFVRPEQLRSGWDRDRIMAEINRAEVPCYSGSCSEIYLEQAFVKHRLQPEQRLPVAKELGETSLMFLVHPTLTRAQINRTCDVLEQVMQAATNPTAVSTSVPERSTTTATPLLETSS
ncbi:MAG: DegT/DnrJ/EryC1/StrS family aminotransferase [Thiolinea sp.]